MKIFTDSLDYIHQLLGEVAGDWQANTDPPDENGIRQLLLRLYSDRQTHKIDHKSDLAWNYLLAVETASESQYDLLIELSQQNAALPNAVLCAAGAGKKFHGFKQRPWESFAGNIHLSVFLAPKKPISHLSSAFMVLPAVSVIQTLDMIPGLENRASIKWVNDIVIDDAKVCGVLAHSQVIKKTVTGAVLGIGLNVEIPPRVAPSPFTLKAASLLDFTQNKAMCNQRIVFNHLIRYLWKNYMTLLNGDYHRLLQIYRTRSRIVGNKVTVCYDDNCTESVSGRVLGIGDNLELKLEGIHQPVTRGRLILSD